MKLGIDLFEHNKKNVFLGLEKKRALNKTILG